MFDLHKNRINKEKCVYSLAISGFNELSEIGCTDVKLIKPCRTIKGRNSFNIEAGNLFNRNSFLSSLTEIFTFDNLDRLTGVIGPAPLTMTYASSGNILSKTSIGNYSYDGSKPHAVTSVTNPDGLIPTNTQRITYTSFNKVDSIIQGNLIYTIAYGSEDQRTKSKLLNNGVPEKTTYYNGGYGKEVSPGNNIRQLHYIEGGDGLAAVFVRNNGQDTMYYIHKDHLGSINVITDQNGAVIQNCSFDAWGRRRNPADWSYNNVPESFFLDRGFTGHEHLDQFGLINMGGRVYDPAIARFLSPDNFVQSPYLTQAFNRYTYCLNNPLKYTDPSGMEYGVGPIYNERWFRNKHRLNDMDGRGGYTYNDQTGYYYNGGGSIVSYDEVHYNYVVPNSIVSVSGQIAQDLVGYLRGSDPTSLPTKSEFNADLTAGPGGAMDAAYKIANYLNEFNPVAQLWDIISYTLTGKDRFGNPMSLTQASLTALAFVPVGKIGSLGAAGEKAVGIFGPKIRIPSLTGTANYRIPDQLTYTKLIEVKNVSHLSLTRQITDFYLFSQQTGKQFILYTRPTTTFSGPLQDLINQGSIIVRPIIP